MIITLDFETFWAQDYSLSRMTTEAYVRDKRFKPHGLAIKIDDEPARFYKPHVLWRPEWRKLIQENACLFHHAHFDGLILSHHFQLVPAFYLDTLSMARMALPHVKSKSLAHLAEHFNVGRKDTAKLMTTKGMTELDAETFENLATYSEADVELTKAIFDKLIQGYPPEELKVIDQCVRLFTMPILRLNTSRLTAYKTAVMKAKQDALSRLGVTKDMLQSAEKFSALLIACGVEPPTKMSPSNPTKPCDCTFPDEQSRDFYQAPDPNCFLCGGEGVIDNMIYAFAKTDDGMKALLEHDDPVVVALAEARLGEKSTLTETRSQRLLDCASRGAFTVYLNYAGAHTLRFSGGDKMNWQNLPSVITRNGQEVTGAEQKGEIRRSVVAPEGCVIAVADSSQGECRLLNTMAGQEDIVQAFRERRDIYSEGASRFYGRTITKADKPERFLGKRLELGCGYGMWAPKFQMTCKIGDPSGMSLILSDDEAKNAVESYRWSHKRVVEYWGQATEILSHLYYKTPGFQWGILWVEGGKIYHPSGQWLDYTNLRMNEGAGSRNRWYTVDQFGKHHKIYGGLLVENITQWVHRIAVTQAWLRIADAGRGWLQVACSTHDDLLAVTPEQYGQAAVDLMCAELRRPLVWLPQCPLDAEGGFAREYSK